MINTISRCALQFSKTVSSKLLNQPFNSPLLLSSTFRNHCVTMAPKVQQKAPHFEGIAVVNNQFKDIKLTDFEGSYLVLFFYPLDFTFVCPTEITAFSDRIEDFKALKTNVVACSCDSQYTHLAWTNVPRKEGGLGKINYPILSDFSKKIAESYGVLLDNGIPLRGLFIIDPKGILRQITINDLPVGRHVDEVLRLVKAFQYTDQHGEVCPANWQPNSNTIKPDPKASKEYFNKVDNK